MTYQGKEIMDEINEIAVQACSGRCFDLEELRKTKPMMNGQLSLKKTITEKKVKDFLKRMKLADYSIIDQLKKTPAQISLVL